jgi:hypothetical protein
LDAAAIGRSLSTTGRTRGLLSFLRAGCFVLAVVVAWYLWFVKIWYTDTTRDKNMRDPKDVSDRVDVHRTHFAIAAIKESLHSTVAFL